MDNNEAKIFQPVQNFCPFVSQLAMTGQGLELIALPCQSSKCKFYDTLRCECLIVFSLKKLSQNPDNL